MINRRFFTAIIFLLFSLSCLSQVSSVTISGMVKQKTSKAPLAYANVVVETERDSSFVAGTATKDDGRFTLTDIKPGQYRLKISFTGFRKTEEPLFIGSLSGYLDIPVIEMEEVENMLGTVIVTSRTSEQNIRMDKKTYSLAGNVSQAGGSILQNMQNLAGVTVQDGKLQLRGSDKVIILIDGKQTALTGFGSQTGLDNLPASGVDRIEIINTPSASYDANGSAGIINIIMKKNRQYGLNGKAGISTGLGSLWVRKSNLPGIRPQYKLTPKVNPSLSVNYRKNKINLFLQADNLYTHTLNKNEFVTRIYDDGTHIRSQLKRNRNTNFFTTKGGIDWFADDRNTITISGMFGSEKILDRGDQPFFDGDLTHRLRLWQFLEDELKTTTMGTAAYQHKFKDAGHLLNIGLNYTFHREDEKYYYDNYLPASDGTDAFKLLSDEQVYDFNADYIKPLRFGRIETGIKFRNRSIPTNMQFIPGQNSVLDSSAGGWANYKEIIPAVYGNYVFETSAWEAELGLRLEYVKIRYNVNPDHNTYKSDGYHYTQPFPNFRIAHKLKGNNKLSFSFSRRVDRPNEVDIRIFPKYDDAEIIKVGNPALRPQFTNSLELGYKQTWNNGYLFTAIFHRFISGTITRISSTGPGSTLIYAVFQNAGKSYNSGIEAILNQKLSSAYTINLNGTLYRNLINAFSVESLYPQPTVFSADRQTAVSGNLKLNNNIHFPGSWDLQWTMTYWAPDIIPQGRTLSRFSVDAGLKRTIQKGKGEIYANATDLLNTMVARKKIQGDGFHYTSYDYYETQTLRIGYSYRF